MSDILSWLLTTILVVCAILLLISIVSPILMVEMKIKTRRIIKVMIRLSEAMGVGLMVNAITNLQNASVSVEDSILLLVLGIVLTAAGRYAIEE